MLRQIALILPIFLAGILLGVWACEPSPSSNNARDFDHAADYQRLEQMISALTEILDMEVAERRILEARIEELAIQIENMGGQTNGIGNGATKKDNLTAEQSKQLALSRERQRSDSRVATVSALTESRLIEVGFQPDVAARLKREIDKVAMDHMYLRDQAVREGWLGSSRYRDELRALNTRLVNPTNDLGPDDYSRFLYAVGRPNRIVINSVMTDSPASQSGLQPGDAIVSYDGARTYSPAEVRREASRGSAGAMVAVEILRDGLPEVIYLPRGPLGVNMSAVIARPES